MSLYFSSQELEQWNTIRKAEPAATIHWAMLRRANDRSENPGLLDYEATVDWWHLVVEYLAEAATAYRFKPESKIGKWIVSATMEIVQRDEDDWAGPWFRRRENPSCGYLETAHVCIAVAAAIDLASDAFTEEQLQQVREVLRERGIPQCQRWLDRGMFYNQRAILAAGMAAASVGSRDKQAIQNAVQEFKLCCGMFEPDGSYGESTQYASYSIWGMSVMYETLVRYDTALADELSIEAYAKCVRWWATSLMYMRPLSGWGSAPRARMANFSDAGAIAAPDGDVLLHIAARCKHSMPEEASLARWLFETIYVPILDEGPFDRASFGFVTRPGFLAPALWTHVRDIEPKSPAQLGMATFQPFNNGDVITRDAWDGQTVLATRGGGELLHVMAHPHPDMNSFILAHRKERLLVDPGHSCYRGLPITYDRATRCHNTCTFTRVDGKTNPGSFTNQITQPHRRIVDGKLQPLVDRGGRRLIAQQLDDISVIGSECSSVYGDPLKRYARFWIMAGPNALFVVDHIIADEPIRTHWHWVLNNRDGKLRLKVPKNDRMVVRRGEAGMKLFHVSQNLDASFCDMTHAYVHDAYHPKPNQLGEGASNTGVIINMHQKEAVEQSVSVHAIAMDSYGDIAGWHLQTEESRVGLESPDAKTHWAIEATASKVGIRELISGKTYELADAGRDQWSLNRA